jgi:hypothetical protein
MSCKNIYQKTFDEVNISNEMMAKLMLLNCNDNEEQQHEHLLYYFFKTAVALLGVLFASGTLFSVPIV